MSCPHTGMTKGKRVFITLKNGSRFIDKYVEKYSKGIKLQNYGRVRTRDLRAMTIYRGQVL